ncbi:hypothetical protein BC941DRAFT_423216 [Chlamydoabsidia padenii]|nr:hypothetical protein BC941DRAFT_423216 [Chlamydoabsidia padenii]
MFGSIAPSNNTPSIEKSIVNRPPQSPTNSLDPWDDTSLVQFWQQSIDSYKKHHTDPDLSKATIADPLVERLKRTGSTIPEDQTTTKKRTKTDDHERPNTNFPPVPPTSIPSPPVQKVTYDINTPYQTTDDIGDQTAADETANDDEEVYDEGHDEQDEQEYGEVDELGNQEYHDYYNGSYGYNYPYQQNHHYNQHTHHPHPPGPAPMPFAPPPLGQHDNGNEALTNMIMAWYYSGYYTGLYQAQHR